MHPTNEMYYQTDNSLVEFPILVVVMGGFSTFYHFTAVCNKL